MGTNMYPSASLLGQQKDSNLGALPIEELIETADGFAGVFPGGCFRYGLLATITNMAERRFLTVSEFDFSFTAEHKYEIVKKLQEMKHICGMTGDGVNDAPALKKADIGIAVADATDAARGASDIVLTEPGLSVIIHAVLTSRAIFQRMKNYTVRFSVLFFQIMFASLLHTYLGFPLFLIFVDLCSLNHNSYCGKYMVVA